MTDGREIDAFRRAMRGYIGRTTGRGYQEHPTVLAMRRMYTVFDADKRPTLDRDSTGAPVLFQHEDGTFPYMPGYDGPIG